MASLAGAKTLVNTFSNAGEWVQVVYDFSVDGGATGDYTVLTAGADLVVLDFYEDIQTQVTSAGTSVSDLGIGAGGTEFYSAKQFVGGGVASLSADTINTMTTVVPVRLASASSIVMSIDTAARTAGKTAYNFFVKKIA